METVGLNRNFWCDKRVLVSGHTGFKGGWLSVWLELLGAKVTGYSLAPSEVSEFYKKAFDGSYIGSEVYADLNDYKKLREVIEAADPEVIFHLAAQPLVRESYNNPRYTFETNVMGVVNLFEAVRQAGATPVIVNATTDKVYKNNEWIWAYRENDLLGGSDPYSASKACSELVTECFSKAFFEDMGINLATVRAGNVIGGGDMSWDRLIPDYFRALIENRKLKIRNPGATRPWQYVLEPIFGYLLLAEKLAGDTGNDWVGPWNFGPLGNPLSVSDLLSLLENITGVALSELGDRAYVHEASDLRLDSTKSRELLDWEPKLDIETSLRWTVDWFNRSRGSDDMYAFSVAQISNYMRDG